jgi:hypothetical protein
MAKAKKCNLEGWQTEAELAEEWDTTEQTLRKQRRLGTGPPWAKVPGLGVIYNIAGKHEWLRNRTVQPRRMRA